MKFRSGKKMNLGTLIPQDLGFNKQSIGPWNRRSGQSGTSHRESARRLIRSEYLSYLAYASGNHQNAFQLDPVKQEEGHNLGWIDPTESPGNPLQRPENPCFWKQNCPVCYWTCEPAGQCPACPETPRAEETTLWIQTTEDPHLPIFYAQDMHSGQSWKMTFCSSEN